MNKKITALHTQFTRLRQVHDALTSFNQSFSAFLFGMAAVNGIQEWKETFSHEHIEQYEKVSPQVPDKVLLTKKRKRTSPAVKQTAQINILKVIDDLPRKYREQTQYMASIKSILKVLKQHPEGLFLKSIVAETKMPRYKVTECVNALVHSKLVLRQSSKGQYTTFKLDPSKYPTFTNLDQ
ncbi:hypothetical protein BDB01DRAFT_846809 [Pilobolus umbonatus]|nr:hypothetical protein BDB01DRAFT_846809 [Pilobolus umbonatus]